MTEGYVSNKELMQYYGDIHDGIGSISQMPINFSLVNGLHGNLDALKVKTF